MIELDQKLKNIYEDIALSEDDRSTASDYHLRDLEIDFGLEYIRNGDTVLDVGCGPGVALIRYASERSIKAHGLDYAKNMIAFAKKRVKNNETNLNIQFKQGSVLALPYENNLFDIVTSHRCLMALLDWDRQCHALLEICRVLKPGGIFVMMEGTLDGLERLNYYRQQFKLPIIAADGRDRLLTLKFREHQLLSFMNLHYDFLRTQRFGMYYFLTRIVHPLFVAPENPHYEHKLNDIAKQIAKLVPDFEGIGHLVGFVFRKPLPEKI